MAYKRRRAIIWIVVSLLVGSFSYQIHKEINKEEYVVGEYSDERITSIHMIRKKIEHDERVIEEEIEKQRREKAVEDFKNSDEYKLIQKERELESKYDIEIKELVPITFKVTAYSSLPEENGGYTITCNGDPLEGNIVANNTIPQYTPILLGDELYTVSDRGSSRFDKINRLDLLLERNYGESTEAYRKRVSEYGVKYIDGYIMYN